jgi:hypothetical protein
LTLHFTQAERVVETGPLFQLFHLQAHVQILSGVEDLPAVVD